MTYADVLRAVMPLITAAALALAPPLAEAATSAPAPKLVLLPVQVDTAPQNNVPVTKLAMCSDATPRVPGRVLEDYEMRWMGGGTIGSVVRYVMPTPDVMSDAEYEKVTQVYKEAKLSVLTLPKHGILQRAAADGRYLYTPALGFIGSDTIRWRVELKGKVYELTETIRVFNNANMYDEGTVAPACYLTPKKVSMGDAGDIHITYSDIPGQSLGATTETGADITPYLI